MNEDKIFNKLLEHDKRFDLIAKKLDEHDKRFDTLEFDFKDFKSKVLTTQDEMITVLRRLDEERVFSAAWVNRMEKQLEIHREEITKIKQALHIT